MSLLQTQQTSNKNSGFNIENVNQKKLKYIKFHEDTSASKATLRIEKKLLTELNNIMRFFKENYASKIDENMFNDFRIVYDQFVQDMETNVFNIIRSYVTKTYTLTTEYVADALAVSGFLTKDDITIIEQLSHDFTTRFFLRIKNVLETKNKKFLKTLSDVFIPAFFNQDQEDIDKNEDQLNVFVKGIERSESFLFSSLAILIINTTIHRATIIKTRKIILNVASNQSPIFQGAREDEDELIDPNEAIDEMLEDFGTKKVDRVKTGNVFFIWKTAQDDRVCFYCQDLEDRVFSVLSATIPTPEQDTHLNCRCKLMLIYI